MGKKNKRKGIVFSTDPDFDYEYEQAEEQDELPANQQRLRVFIDRKKRKGKAVTLVSGFVGPESSLKALGKTLKSKCGVGGSVKDGEIIIQGELKGKVVDILKSEGFTNTKASGG